MSFQGQTVPFFGETNSLIFEAVYVNIKINIHLEESIYL